MGGGPWEGQEAAAMPTLRIISKQVQTAGGSERFSGLEASVGILSGEAQPRFPGNNDDL